MIHISGYFTYLTMVWSRCSQIGEGPLDFSLKMILCFGNHCATNAASGDQDRIPVCFFLVEWAWSAVQMDQLVVAACIRLWLQNTKDESRDTRQTCTARSNSCVRMVKVCDFSSQILFPQRTGREKQQCRWTIRNIFECMSKASFSSVDLCRVYTFKLKILA